MSDRSRNQALAQELLEIIGDLEPGEEDTRWNRVMNEALSPGEDDPYHRVVDTFMRTFHSSVDTAIGAGADPVEVIETFVEAIARTAFALGLETGREHHRRGYPPL